MEDIVFSIQKKEKPQICGIDLDHEIVEALRAKGLNCFTGTLGSQVKIPINRGRSHICDLNYNFPPNLHEYDIVIIDLQTREPIEYLESDHIKFFIKGKKEFFKTEYPETLFDPRPLSSTILGAELQEFLDKETLIIVFYSLNEEFTYYPIEITGYDSFTRKQRMKESLYGFMQYLPKISTITKMGKKIEVEDRDNNFNVFLNKYKKEFLYEVVFFSPREWSEDKKSLVQKKDFVPLLLNDSKEIVGFIDSSLKASAFLAFPQLYDSKKEFLLELVDEILPEFYPNIFPFSEQFSWLKLENYFLPNQANLMSKKSQLEDEYKAAWTDITK